MHYTIITLHEKYDYGVRTTVAILRDSYGSEEISSKQRSPGKINLVDALTKRNLQIYKLLNDMTVYGILDEMFLVEAKRIILKDQRL